MPCYRKIKDQKELVSLIKDKKVLSVNIHNYDGFSKRVNIRFHEGESISIELNISELTIYKEKLK